MKQGLLLCALLLPAFTRADGQLDIEVVLFRHVDADPARIAALREPGSYEELRPLAPVPDGVEAGKGEPPRDYPHWTTLPDDQLRLAPVVKALERGGAYAVLLHTGWRQPTDSKHRVRLQAGEPPVLDGSLQVLGGGRKMQVLEDFTLLAGETPVRVQAKQQMKTGELRYVDHHLLGLLVKATPVNSAEPPAESDAASSPPALEGEAPVAAPADGAGQAGPAD